MIRALLLWEKVATEKMEKKWKENNGGNSGPLTSLPVDRLTATDCNADARAKNWVSNSWYIPDMDRLARANVAWTNFNMTDKICSNFTIFLVTPPLNWFLIRGGDANTISNNEGLNMVRIYKGTCIGQSFWCSVWWLARYWIHFFFYKNLFYKNV